MSVLAQNGYTLNNLPTGAVVAKSNLQDVWLIKRPEGDRGIVFRESLDTNKSSTWGGFMPDEFHLGDYSDGRYAWELTNVQQLPEPIPVKGKQGLWNWIGEQELEQPSTFYFENELEEANHG